MEKTGTLKRGFTSIIQSFGLRSWIAYAACSRSVALYRSRDRKRLFLALEQVGYRSIPLVLMIGFFAGSTIAWQAAYQFKGLVSLTLLGGQSARIIVMEMAPVMTGIVIAGRIASPFAAEWATLVSTGQRDALKLISIDPWRFLLMPRWFAICGMMPILMLFSVASGLIGSWVVSHYFLSLSAPVFWGSIQLFFQPADIGRGVLKAACFGLGMACIAGYHGFYSESGSNGIRNAGIRTFVETSIMILVLDYVLWFIMY